MLGTIKQLIISYQDFNKYRLVWGTRSWCEVCLSAYVPVTRVNGKSPVIFCFHEPNYCDYREIKETSWDTALCKDRTVDGNLSIQFANEGKDCYRLRVFFRDWGTQGFLHTLLWRPYHAGCHNLRRSRCCLCSWNASLSREECFIKFVFCRIYQQEQCWFLVAHSINDYLTEWLHTKKKYLTQSLSLPCTFY